MTIGTSTQRIHFSDLKKFAISALHFQASVGGVLEETRAMRIGTITHHEVLGPHTRRPLVMFDGPKRAGKAWEAFEVANAGSEIVTKPEWEDAQPLVVAVQSDPVAAGLLKGCRREVALEWEDSGFKCATDGIDFVGEGYIGDLKTTSCAEPSAFSRHAAKLWYHAQLAWMRRGAIANWIDTSKGLFIIAVESSQPHAVTCFELTEETILQGEKSLALWLERLRAAVENDHWPAYSQCIVPLELPSWMGDQDPEVDA